MIKGHILLFLILLPSILAIEQAILIRTIDASLFPSPDSAGITYLSDRLLISDSEINEMTIYSGVNMFEIDISGNLLRTWDTKFSNEPTGVAYNPNNNHLFISDDNARKIFELNPGPDNIYGNNDDSVNSFSTSNFGSTDPEGVAYDYINNHLFIIDGVGKTVFHVKPGIDNIFDGNDQVSKIDVSQYGMQDPEGIAFNQGSLFIVDISDIVIEVTTAGELIRKIDISAANIRKPAGIVYVSGSLYIVDRGVDNDNDPNENDGKIYELSIKSALPFCGDGQCIDENCENCPEDCGQCSLPGDINGDNTVDLIDLILVARNFQNPNFDARADANNDGQVNLLDLIAVARNFGKIY